MAIRDGGWAVRRIEGVTLWLVLLAIGVRAGAVLVLDAPHTPRSTYEHGEIAANLVAGRGFSMEFLGSYGPTSQQAPVYPCLVAAAYAVGGVESPRALLYLELGQAVLGGVLVLGVARLANEVLPGQRLASWAAGCVAALHPTLVYAATHVQVAPVASVLLVWTLALAYAAGRTGRLRDRVGTGIVLGVLVLTDPILALVCGGVGLAIGGRAWSRGGMRTVAVELGTVGLISTVVVMPWLVRNARVHHEFVAVKSTFGYAFWQGNCRLSEGTDKVVRPSVERELSAAGAGDGLAGLNRKLWAARHEAGCIDDVMLSRADRAWLGRLPEPARSRVLFRWACADLAAEPGRYARLCLKRLRYFLLFDETNPKTRVLAYRVSHLGLSLAAVAGLLLAGGRVLGKLGPTLLTAVLVTLFHIFTITSARFHIPLEPVLGLWFAAGLARAREAVPALARQVQAIWFRLGRFQPRLETTSNSSGS